VDFKTKHPWCVFKGLTTRGSRCPCQQQQLRYQVVKSHEEEITKGTAEVATIQLYN
jgi:hypothetical protein